LTAGRSGVYLADNRRLQRLLQLAKLRENACMEDIDYKPGRGLDRAEMASLALGNWIRHGHNLILTGPTVAAKPGWLVPSAIRPAGKAWR
jgi:hypothetical protein